MDMPGNGSNVEAAKGTEETVNYHAPNISPDWHVNGNNTTNTSIGMISMRVEPSSCSSMVDSFCPPIWDQPINGTNWKPNAMLRENMFLSTVPRMFPPPSSSHLPADSGFIERAARFSCFNGGHFSQMVNPFSILDPLMNLNSHLGLMQRPNEAFVIGNGLKAPEISKEDLLIGELGAEGNSFKNEKNSDFFTRSHDEVENGVDVLGTQSDEAAGFSGRDPQEEFDGTAGEFSGKGVGFKKRKRAEQNNENNEAQQLVDENKQKCDENRFGKGSDPPKEEYIHVRARRGQATNSHSLAERIRREKISDRMKFLQGLVPGCSKVTGKAVMLDEIINYVQSLQRQVEFLSMKLATVNPQLDFNMEGFLAKDILQTRAGLSASLGFPPDMTMPFPRVQPGLIQAVLIPGLGNSSETLRRPISLQSNVVCGGLQEPTSHAPGVWDNELHNIVHNVFNLSAPLNSSDLSGHTKAEP